MKRNYYFLAASLPELVRGQGGTESAGDVQRLLERCGQEMHPDDFFSLKCLFLLNDIANAVSYRKPGDAFLSPSFYGPEELAAGIKEPERLLPFLARHFERSAAGRRARPELREEDELALELYAHLEDIPDVFVRGYYLFELDLRNIAAAFELRRLRDPLEGNLVPFGAAYEMIVSSSAEDFGLSDTHPYVKRLLEASRRSGLTESETILDDVLWEWLRERLEGDFFSSDYILGYMLKLRSLKRWGLLREEAGSELFEELLNTVRRSVRFAIEFSKINQGAPT
jgi:hypothetical protein